MSFGGSVPKEQFKSFVTESEIEEKRKVRQLEWERVRKPDEPLGNLDYFEFEIES